MTDPSVDSDVDDDKGWSFDHIKDDTEDGEDLPEDEDGSSVTEESNSIWVVGILSPALVLLFAATFAYLREVLIISALSVPDRVSGLLMSFGYGTVLNLYTVACLVSLVSVIVDSRRTPDRLPGNKHYQAVVILDAAALLAIFLLYFIRWEEMRISGPGVVVVFYVLFPASLVPSGVAAWYVWKRQELLKESRTSTG